MYIHIYILSLSLAFSKIWGFAVKWVDDLSSVAGGTQRCGTQVCHASWSQQPCVLDQHPRLMVIQDGTL